MPLAALRAEKRCALTVRCRRTRRDSRKATTVSPLRRAYSASEISTAPAAMQASLRVCPCVTGLARVPRPPTRRVDATDIGVELRHRRTRFGPAPPLPPETAGSRDSRRSPKPYRSRLKPLAPTPAPGAELGVLAAARTGSPHQQAVARRGRPAPRCSAARARLRPMSRGSDRLLGVRLSPHRR